MDMVSFGAKQSIQSYKLDELGYRHSNNFQTIDGIFMKYLS